ncbi:uncharacterized protein BO72DRAFT_26650 [Aspergillus fijiensis CBS 313.89]|uniref:Uncharacterized protein n=1 Tax=Aspergillus fijiensis CBS 313.89 TaxID=1448319 RepID=A0A8G1RVK4_9EURO|nr:uncharacterized protein BO72DRAFT_26650 [Aspergillus fijiensis CBS 313.89]RAK80019.1 hypothetical protein BO72DRAFT_26650 [Aspergillus fijiensis CBS 313.89]
MSHLIAGRRRSQLPSSPPHTNLRPSSGPSPTVQTPISSTLQEVEFPANISELRARLEGVIGEGSTVESPALNDITTQRGISFWLSPMTEWRPCVPTAD